MRYYLFCFLAVMQHSNFLFGNNSPLTTIDSLKQIISKEKNDSLLVLAYIEWDDLIYFEDPDLDLILNQKIVEICNKHVKEKDNDSYFFNRQMASSLNNIGLYYYAKSESNTAKTYYEKCYVIYQKINDTDGMATILNNLGSVAHVQGDYRGAINYYTRGLQLYEKYNEKEGAGTALSNIGMIYNEQSNPEKALEYYEKSLALFQSINNQPGIATAMNHLGNLLISTDSKKAYDYLKKSYEIRKSLNDKVGMSNCLINIGSYFKKLGDDAFQINNAQLGDVYYQQASDYFNKSIELCSEIHELLGLATSYSALGKIKIHYNRSDEAIQFFNDALKISNEISAPNEAMDASYNLYLVYKKSLLYNKALAAHENYVLLRDSINNLETQQAILRNEYDYKYDKKAAQDSIIRAKENEIHAAQLSAKRNQQYALYGGLALVLLFALFIFKRFKISQKQNKIIEQQKSELELEKSLAEELRQLAEEKNKEIVDSISYAKRIQAAILPSRQLIKKHLPESFVLYLPKDIVAGDFYWLSFAEATDNELSFAEASENELSYAKASDSAVILFAAADCTGHGVPGAMVSVVCNNALNRSVNEYKITDPGKILDKTREIVINEFEKSEEEVKDGMDISLCTLINNSTLLWAGANNGLWIVRNKKVLEYKPNKQPIGKYAQQSAFTSHEIPVMKNDIIYVFTDGFQDQFGGEHGKKYKASRLKDYLLSISHLEMDEQKQLLYDTFTSWKGDLEQVDDICVFAVKIID